MIVIIDYGVGNLSSIQNMLKKGGNESTISSDISAIENASKIILPGMGHFDNCMLKLNASNLRPSLERKILEDKVPVLGICVGLQMFMESSEEGVEKGLGWIKGNTIKFKKDILSDKFKIPNMGWLDVDTKKESKLVVGLNGSRFYFAHSYYVDPVRRSDILLTANYGYNISVALEYENIMGVQFHPEKSHRYGMHLLRNFAELI